ncbi:DMT family transporter [Candidatus Thorarchaeota archaeon]|nr:MAG: DMT family transporter [Candidatus Thorarchaeota archaeon]
MWGELAALTAAFCFAVAATIYKEPLRTLSAVSASILRFAGTTAILIVMVLFLWGPQAILGLPAQVIVLSFGSGVIGLAFGDVLYMHSFKEIGVARTVSLVGTYPLFTLVIEFLIGRSAIPFLAIIGTPLIFVGIWLLSQRMENHTENSESPLSKSGIFAGLATSFLYSISMLLVNDALLLLSSEAIESAVAVNTLRTAGGGVSLLLAAPIIDRDRGFLKVTRRIAMLLLVGSFIAYGVGWYLLTLGFALAPAAFVVPLSATTPLFAVVSAVILLREPLHRRGVLGVIASVGGVIVILLA